MDKKSDTKEKIPLQTMTKSIKDRILIMLELEQNTDCQFIFPNEEEKDGEEKSIIKAHKLQLAFASPVFNAMFYSFDYNEDRDNIVEILDYSIETFVLFLKYVYLHQIELTRLDEATEVFSIAHKYEVPCLEKICEKYIIANICPEQACSVFSFAKLYNNTKIMVKVIDVITKETEKVLKCQDFLEAQLETVEFIMRKEDLKVESEIVLLEALEKYTIKNKLGRKTVDKMLKQIRFLTLSVEEFNERVMRSRLLTDTEKLAIINNILSENSPAYAYPKGFSTYLTKRS